MQSADRNSDITKKQVQDFWDEAACGEILYLPSTDRAGFEAQAQSRYRLEPYIMDLAKFAEARGKRVLEIGVGLGADHQQFAEAGAELYGVDLTPRAVAQTRQRFAVMALTSRLSVGDAENLCFPDETFDLVYSFGVIHHSPDTPRCVREIHRVLKPGGKARVMIYHRWSLVGFMLWIRYALLTLRPWRSLDRIYSDHLESPGTKAYSHAAARQLFSGFRDVRTWTVMTHGDLLTSDVGQRHQGMMLTIAKHLWPRWIFKRFFPNLGLSLLIEATR
jgi:SAM-dependent methyltransferase